MGIKINKSIEIVKNIESSIKIELFTDKREKVISEVAPLNQWTLSHSLGIPSVYAYMRGKYNEQPLSDGAVKLVPIYTGIDCGKGTYFQPRKNSTYFMEVTIAPTKKMTNEKVIIMMNDIGQSSKCP